VKKASCAALPPLSLTPHIAHQYYHSRGSRKLKPLLAAAACVAANWWDERGCMLKNVPGSSWPGTVRAGSYCRAGDHQL